MASPRRFVAIFAGLLVAGYVLADPPTGDAPAPPEGVPVEIETADGGKLTGPLGLKHVRLRTSYGAADLAVGHLRKLDVSKANDGRVTATATLDDKSHQTGQLLTEAFPVAAEGGPRSVPAGEVRVVTFPKPKDTSLAAALIGLLTLSVMEIILGVDNIIFLAILASKVDPPLQPRARQIGLIAALGTRILLLFSLTWLLGLTRPLFDLPELPFLNTAEARGVSWRDIILLAGGVFLIGKSVVEMHEKLEHAKAERKGGPPVTQGAASFASVIAQIAVIDIVFSLDSVITAVGMVEDLWVMVTAMLIAVGVMMFAAGPISRFVDRRPTVKVLALAFLILIGVLLVAEALGQHIDKGYIYFAMAFAVGVEMVNMRLRKAPASGEHPGAAEDG
jgi:predicted tellurium resistance membrane protein TerC